MKPLRKALVALFAALTICAAVAWLAIQVSAQPADPTLAEMPTPTIDMPYKLYIPLWMMGYEMP